MNFEQQLTYLQAHGLRVTDCLNSFGRDFKRSPFIKAAKRIYDRGTGDVDFDVAPVVSALESGA